jgi:hypothetical protein
MIWIFNLNWAIKAPKGTPIPPKKLVIGMFGACIYKLQASAARPIPRQKTDKKKNLKT